MGASRTISYIIQTLELLQWHDQDKLDTYINQDRVLRKKPAYQHALKYHYIDRYLQSVIRNIFVFVDTYGPDYVLNEELQDIILVWYDMKNNEMVKNMMKKYKKGQVGSKILTHYELYYQCADGIMNMSVIKYGYFVFSKYPSIALIMKRWNQLHVRKPSLSLAINNLIIRYTVNERPIPINDSMMDNILYIDIINLCNSLISRKSRLIAESPTEILRSYYNKFLSKNFYNGNHIK